MRRRMRARMMALGRSASVELSPAQVNSSCVGVGALAARAQVFVNMVSTDERHFEAVAAATEVLAQNGRVPVPHVPASRFRRSSHPHPPLGGGGGGSSDEDAAAHPGSEEVVGALPALDATLRRLCLAGGERVMLVGGNDQYERRAEAFESAGELLRTGALRRAGFRGVVLAGHPEGHVGLGGCRVATRELLISKVREASAQGLEVAVATQLCFDGDALTRWLAETRALVAPTPVTFHVGVPGPTTRQKLARIAAICEVRTGAGAGPSTFVGNSEPVEQQEHQQQKQDEEGDVSGGLVWPTALVQKLADWSERMNSSDRGTPPLREGEVVLHVFALGGLAPTAQMLWALSSGTWPPLPPPEAHGAQACL